MTILSIVAALMLQTSPLVTAECIFDNMGPLPCQVAINQNGEYTGYGFALPGSNIIVFGARKINETQANVELLSINDITARVEGACIIKPSERIIGCTALVNGSRITVVARTND